MADPVDQPHTEEIRRLQELLEERTDTIEDLQTHLSSCETELKFQVEKLQNESQQTIRRLEEELRRLKHENLRMTTKRKATEITPTHGAGNRRSEHSNETSSWDGATAVQQKQHPTTPSVVQAATASPAIRHNSAHHQILMQLSPLMTNQQLSQRLWLARNEVDMTKLLMDAEEWELALVVLQSSPRSCRCLVGTTHVPTTSITIGNTTNVDLDDGSIDLMSRLWTPTAQVTPTKPVVDNTIPIDDVWETAAQSPERRPVWDILQHLLRYYDLPFPLQHQTTILNRLIQVGRACTTSPHRQGFDDYREDNDTTDEPSKQTVPSDWIGAAIACLEAYICRTSVWDELHQSKLWGTWFAVVLDMAEQCHDLRLPMVRWLRVLASCHSTRTDVLDVFLRVEIVTFATTAELWHRAPSAIHVVCHILSDAVSKETLGEDELYLFRTEPSELIVECIRFLFAIVTCVQEARRQEKSLAVWDITPAETLASNVALLLDRTEDEELKRMLQTILDELEEDYNDRYAKYKSPSTTS